MVDSINCASGSANTEYASMILQAMDAGRAIQPNAKVAAEQQMQTQEITDQYETTQAQIEEMNAEIAEYTQDTVLPDYSTISYSV